MAPKLAARGPDWVAMAPTSMLLAVTPGEPWATVVGQVGTAVADPVDGLEEVEDVGGDSVELVEEEAEGELLEHPDATSASAATGRSAAAKPPDGPIRCRAGLSRPTGRSLREMLMSSPLVVLK